MRRILLSMIAGTLALTASAIPAKPGKIRYQQPDGSVVSLEMIGDEFGHVIFSTDRLVVLSVDGEMQYARFDSSGKAVPSGRIVKSENLESKEAARLQPKEKIEAWVDRVMQSSPRRVKAKATSNGEEPEPTDSEDSEERLVPLNFGLCTSTFPVVGVQKALVVLVEYQDVEFKFGSYDYFHRMLNEEGFSDNGSLGSARDFFVDNSYGLFLPDFDVYGPVVLPENRAYYGANSFGGDDQNPEMMAVHALQILDDEVDFSQYDRDGDGFIDNVFIFYAGKGEHDTGVANYVWPHSWEVTSAGHSEPFIFDGVQLDHYACTCEYSSGYKRPDGIGTFVHEFSHVMGLPDLYVTTYSGGFTPGRWSTLDSGPYNNHGLTPPNYSSFERVALGWMEMLPLEEGLNELPNLMDSNKAFAVPTASANEYFYFENRQQTGNDRFIPGHGMLVWHIDYLKSAWDYNTVNNNSAHQRVDIVEADNKKSESTRSGDSFPGNANVTEFRCDTAPKFLTWKKKKLDFDLIEIAESDEGIISFTAITHDELHPEGTGIESVKSESPDSSEYFDMLGRKVDHPSKGIYIKDGKKVILK